LIPRGFASYVRLFHPARSPSGKPVRWAEVAAWNGRQVHPLMAFERVSNPREGKRNNPPWSEDPAHGSMDKEVALALSKLLGSFTSVKDRCFFGVWEGYGQFGRHSRALLTRSGAIKISPPEEVESAQRIHGVGRDYLVYTGALSSIDSFFQSPWTSPNMWWPADRSWFVSTDIDLDSTYVGGSKDCIDELMSDASFETLPIDLDEPTYFTADTVNAEAE
ncbi:MAG: hypothetical protein ACRD1T_20680, partial [Acidimicrobiia bacterium]